MRPATSAAIWRWSPRSSARRRAEVEAVLTILQGFDPPGVCARNLPECLAIQLKERDRFDPAMQALVAHLDLLAQARSGGVAQALRRERRRSDRHDRTKSASSTRSPAWRSGRPWCSRSCRMCSCAPGRDGGFIIELNSDTLPKVLVNQSYSRRSRQDREERQGQDLPRRLPADRDLADPRARSARQDHPESLDRDRAPAGCFLRARRPAPAPAQSQDHRGCHRHARIDGLARHRQQVHGDQPRHLRAEVFLHFGDRGGGRRRGAFGGSRAPSHQAADRCRKPARRAVRRHHRGKAARGRHRHRAANRRKVSRGDAHPSSVQRRREKQTAMGHAP